MNSTHRPPDGRAFLRPNPLSERPDRSVRFLSAALLAAAVLSFPTLSCALPSFARQMNLPCIACHTEYPILNNFGRQFKLTGYTLSTSQSEMPPLAFMVQPSFTHTQKSQDGGAAPGYSANNNFAFTQVSLFYAGRLFGPYASNLFGADVAKFVNKFGIFLQTTYDGVGKAWSWDNTEVRYADRGTLGGKTVAYGIYSNNNPTLQDPWNSTPAWGYPFTGSGLAPGPAAATFIDGSTAGQVGGVGAYALYDGSFYVDVAGYRTLGTNIQKSFGVDPSGETQINGVAPYWRLAYTKPVGDGSWEVGSFGIAAHTYPGRDQSSGADRIVDLGLDSQYQTSFGHNDVTAMLQYIHEDQSWSASQALGLSTNAKDSLWNVKATVEYLYDKTYGLTVQYFDIAGGSDAALYGGSATGSPNSDGFILQANYLPFNKGGGPSFWPRSNVKFTAQYTIYNRFNGASSNYDGNGANARDNNTLYLEAWIVF